MIVQRYSADRFELIGALSGIASLMLISALPLLKGYYFYGYNDSLTQFGISKDILFNQLDPTSILYPSMHHLSVAITMISGIPLRIAHLSIVPIFVMIFSLGVTISSKEIGARYYYTGIVASMFLFPIIATNLPSFNLSRQPSQFWHLHLYSGRLLVYRENTLIEYLQYS